jgi:hypothetical protein
MSRNGLVQITAFYDYFIGYITSQVQFGIPEMITTWINLFLEEPQTLQLLGESQKKRKFVQITDSDNFKQDLHILALTPQIGMEQMDNTVIKRFTTVIMHPELRQTKNKNLCSDLAIFYFTVTRLEEYLWLMRSISRRVRKLIVADFLHFHTSIISNIATITPMIVNASAWSFALAYPIYQNTDAELTLIPSYGPLLLWFLSLLDMKTLQSKRVSLLRACQPFNLLFPISDQGRFIDTILSQMGRGLAERYVRVKDFVLKLDRRAQASRCYVLNVFGLITFVNIENYAFGVYNSAPQRTVRFLPDNDRRESFTHRLSLIEDYILTGRPENGYITPINVVEFLQDVLGDPPQ